MKSTKSVVVGLAMVACAFAFSSCTTTTRVVEVNRYVSSRPAPRSTVIYTSKPAAKTPPPSEFRVINQYDSQR